MILFQNTLFLKEFLASNSCFGLFSKIKRGLEQSFGEDFLHDFYIKIFLIKFSINWQSFNAIPYFFLKLSNKMCYKVLIQTVGDIINFKMFLGSSSKPMADREKKSGRQKDKNLNISRTKRAFQMKYKTFFIVFKGLSFDEK